MATEAGQGAARRRVMAAMAERGWTPSALAKQAGIDYGTVGDFLNGKRWPKIPTMSKIERTLGWTPGTLAAIGEELEPPTVSGDNDDEDALLYRAPDGVDGPEWDRIKREAKEFIEWQVSRAAQER